jgi:subtilisin family serine protease
MKKQLLLWLALAVSNLCATDNITYMFRIMLTDKGSSACTTARPQEFLSQPSIDRRTRQGIAVDETDLPIDTAYIRRIEALGTEIVAQSKWLQTITVRTTDSLLIDGLLALPFTDTLYLVYRKILPQPAEKAAPDGLLTVQPDPLHTGAYGAAFDQIAIHNGHLLHEKGFRGAGMTIAVIDGGFRNADTIDALDRNKIVEAKDFSYLRSNPYRTSVAHGTQVLSCMLADKQNVYTGTAPDAHYRLFSSEVADGEFPVEEDCWIAAIEYADSIGVDISTTSLGYNLFDLPEMNHAPERLDGQSALISRAARMAAEKGILVLHAAGNEGEKPWQTITFPSDADKTLTVGAIRTDSSLSPFTPKGPTADGRTKPDLVAIGTATAIIGGDGTVLHGNGTSYATPIMAGLTACLWQAFPALTNLEIIDLLRRLSHRFNDPDAYYGYGIPDVFKAFEETTAQSSTAAPRSDSLIRHIGNYLLIDLDIVRLSSCRLTIHNVLGNKVTAVESLPYASFDVSRLPGGLYVAHLEGPRIYQTYKFILR